ncbi:12678_t:CDS:2 [Funneliformis geosporum]|uniref:17715_t:CDS:1 n=1 Tax=Funneliformis geosporum TaxID=1117311 RepID=A0A9W4SLY3_9GLOM|nr:12678_t:CDS:2 [Funneliformis geosporum]CAI2174273.1 17715_t:CDS:2 [Funneliformis geosporum]
MEQRFNIQFLAGENKQTQQENVSDSAISNQRKSSSQYKSQLRIYSSMFRPSSQSDFARDVGDFSNGLTNSYLDFTHSPAPPFNQFTRSDILLSNQISSNSSAAATALQATQTPAIAGECCTECCPVAAAQAATSNRELESNNIVDESDFQKFPPFSFSDPSENYKSSISSSIMDYGNFSHILGQNSSTFRMPFFRHPRTLTSPQFHKMMQDHFSAFLSEGQQQNTDSNVSTKIVPIPPIGENVQVMSSNIETSLESNSAISTMISQVEPSVYNMTISEAALEENAENTFDATQSGSLSDIEDIATMSTTESTSINKVGSKRKEDDAFDETRCLWSTCAAVFRSIDELIPHLSKLHVAGRSKGNFCRWASCSMEKEGSDELIKHLCLDHLETREFRHGCKWQSCHLRFETFEELTGHVSDLHIGSGRSQYICYWEKCDRNGRPFTQRQKVMRHIQTHTGDKPYQCTICKKRFSEANIMTQHMRTHTGERPFKCTQPDCDREKPFKCKYEGCVKRFAESSNLTKHV